METKAILDVETNKIKVVELSDKEIAELTEIRAKSFVIAESEVAQQAARQSALEKLAELGLTDAEIQALVR